MEEILYKVLNEDGSAYCGRVGQWSLPRNGQPGDWMPTIEGELIARENGYQLYRLRDLLGWLGPAIYVAECQGERLDCDDKVVVREAHLLQETGWNERTARLFACDCAERALDIFERKYPDDNRLRKVIEIVRRFANGEATQQELDAARTTTRAVDRDAAWEAAWAAARDATWETAWDAARAAVRANARAAVTAGAWDAERQWQQARLLQYLNGEGEPKGFHQ